MMIDALIVAAGSGQRAGGGLPKQYRDLGGLPVLAWSVRALRADARVRAIVIAIDPAMRAQARQAIGEARDILLVDGGDTRTQSVMRGLEALASHPPDAVLIHDAARPGLTQAVLDALLATLLEGHEGAAPGLPVADALKRTDGRARIVASTPRADLFRVQTPQAFRFEAIVRAYRACRGQALEDDLAVAEAAGLSLKIVPGAQRLQKITVEEDFVVLAHLLSPGGVCRIGTGFDAHRLGPGDFVTLCGIKIAADRGLIGHSDADVAWHALTDALLGAIAAGDIGDHFPPSDPQWKGADSGLFLRHASDLVAQAGARIVNVDLTLICERPRISPHRQAMRWSTAQALGLALGAVSVKATTTEGMGFAGRGEGIAAQAAVSVAMAPPVPG